MAVQVLLIAVALGCTTTSIFMNFELYPLEGHHLWKSTGKKFNKYSELIDDMNLHQTTDNQLDWSQYYTLLHMKAFSVSSWSATCNHCNSSNYTSSFGHASTQHSQIHSYDKASTVPTTIQGTTPLTNLAPRACTDTLPATCRICAIFLFM